MQIAWLWCWQNIALSAYGSLAIPIGLILSWREWRKDLR